MDIVKPIAIFFTSPLNWVVICLMVSLVAHYRRNTRVRKTALNVAAGTFLIFSQPYVVGLLLFPLEQNHTVPTAKQLDNVEIIYTPACYYTSTGNMTDLSRWSECSMQRTIQSYLLAKQLDIPVVVSGENFLKDDSIVYAEKKADFLNELGLQSSQIILIGQGDTTVSEVNAAKEHLIDKTILAVSSASHGERLKRILEPIGKETLFYPVDFQANGQLVPYITWPAATALYKSQRALYEYGAQLKHFLLAKTDGD